MSRRRNNQFRVWGAVTVTALIVSLLSVQSAFGTTPTDLTFAPNSAAQFIINTPGSVLADAAPTEAQGALLASADRFNLAALEPQFAQVSGAYTPTPANPATALSSSDAATFDSIVANYAAPATKLVTVGKTVAGASVAMAGFNLGLLIGSGTSRMFGFNDNMVCEEQNAALTTMSALLDGTDCSAYQNALTETQKNIDIMPVSSFPSTTVDGVNVSFQSGQPWPNLETNELTCFVTSGTRPENYHLTVTVWGANGTTNQTGTWERNDYCPEESNLSGWWVTAPVTGFQAELWSTYNDVTYFSPVVTGTVSTPNPDRHWECDITTSANNRYTSTSVSFTENDAAFAGISCPSIPSGETATNQTIYEVGGDVVTTVQNQNTTDAYQAWRANAPECNNGTCPLLLFQGSDNCFASGVDCNGWIDDPSRATDYTCTYGTHTEPLSWCYIYGPAFDPTNQASGHAYGDPATGAVTEGQTSPTDADRLTANLLTRTGSSAVTATAAATKAGWARDLAVLCLAQFTLSDCEDTTIWAPGNNVPDIATHDANAIAAGRPATLTYMTGAEKAATGVSHGWYKALPYSATGGCSTAPQAGQQCDEYPYYSTAEGGPPNGDLEWTNGGQNGLEGSLRKAFLRNVCHLNAASGVDKEFIVLPDPIVFPTIGWCKS